MSEQLSRLSKALLGSYVMEREIGVGGAARVFSAWDVKHDRHVAIKVLRPELGASVTAERFNREVKLLSQLRHPNILTLIDSGEADGSLFYVMPYVEGQSLRDMINQGPAPLGDAVRLLRDLVDALAYAHRKGLVHRDVKPENVLVDDRHALVTDFGIARAVAGDPDGGRRLTLAGRTLGSPNYMAPEQVAGNPDADARGDIYAFGVVAYELLAGRLPYEAKNTAAMLMAHLNDAPIPLAKARPDVPPALEKIVMRCLEKDPRRRWKSTDDLLHAMEGVATQETAAGAPRRGRRVSPMVVAVGVMFVVTLAFGIWAVRAQRALAGDRWALTVAAPRIERLLGADSIFDAWRVAQEAETKRPHEEAIAEFWPQVATPVNLFTEPTGARASVCAPGDTNWVALGVTPLQGARFPRAVVRLRLEKPGWATVDTVVDYRTMPTTFWLAPAGGR
jgi:tRNA A-37 threonylcarbamoyl transferase component Bud32